MMMKLLLWIVLSSFYIFTIAQIKIFKDRNIQGNVWKETPEILHKTLIAEITKRYENAI